MSTLFHPINLGSIRAPNRIFMAPVCTENPVRVDDVMESPKLAD